ncbi:MAG TPA: glycoside hydrolase family 3 N-terminal domain-containing protein [Acidimicrobiales bacterium]|nr:glycoside hydrolase family 3 N-terminal domain-containing protein [Acidimicrobiales bacterium]
MTTRRTHRAGWLVAGVLAAVLAAASVAVGGAAVGADQTAGSHHRVAPCDPGVNLATWSLARLAAQVVAVPIEAGAVGSLAREVRTGYGGILLFGTSAPPTLGATLRHLQATTPQGLGLLVMTDEEGGGVLRLDNLVAPFPWARTMASTMTAPQITALARRVGAQLLAAGVTMDLAPVLDVDGRNVAPGATDPDGLRSFGGAVAVVTADGAAFAKGLRQAHVVPVVKHFPGLGGSTGNTDYGAAATLPWPTLQASALRTFSSAIQSGAPAVMVSNARVPGLTPLPASLSSKVMTTVLRGQLHFTGLIVTDSLTAGAIAKVPLSVPAAAVAALVAGADLVLLGNAGSAAADAHLAVSVANAIAAAVGRGTLTRATLQGAAAHVLASHGVLACGA